MISDIISAQASHFPDGAQTVLRGHENRSRRVVLLKGNLVRPFAIGTIDTSWTS